MGKQKRKPTRQYGGVDADQRRQERREKFLAAGLEAFGTNGYAKSTIKEICQLAGLTERYFYESFENKEDLLCAVYRRLITEMEEDGQKIIATPGITTEEAVYRAVKNFYLRFKNDPHRARVQLFEVLGVSPRVDREYRVSMQALARWVELSWLALFPDCDRQWLKESIIPTSTAGGIAAVAHKWVLDGFKTPVDDIVNQAMEMFMAVGHHFQGRQS